MLCYFLYGFLYHAWDHNLRRSFLSHNEGGVKNPGCPLLSYVICTLSASPGKEKFVRVFHFGFTSSCCYFFCLCLFVLQKQTQKKCSNLSLLCPSFLGAIILQPRVAPFLVFLSWRRRKPGLQCTELHEDRGIKLYLNSFFLDNI